MNMMNFFFTGEPANQSIMDIWNKKEREQIKIIIKRLGGILVMHTHSTVGRDRIINNPV